MDKFVERNFMREREQKTAAQAADCLQGDRLEAESLAGVQTFMEITENGLVEVQIDEKHLMELIVSPYNMNRAYRKVMSNGGGGGVDSMECKELLPYLKLHKDELKASILNGKYKPQPVRRVEIPKDNGKTRKLGIPTLVDRVIQQSIAQVLSPMYEPQFSEGSFGFRPGRSAHDALKKAQSILNDGYEYAVGIDLERFFDTVNQSYLIELLSHTVKDGRVISLIHKYLYAGVMIDGVYHPTPEGTPQGGPLSPLLSNIVLNELDKELEKRGHPFVRYADDSLIFCKSRRGAERVCEGLTNFIEKKLHLKVNREKTEVGSARGMKFLGYSFYKRPLDGM